MNLKERITNLPNFLKLYIGILIGFTILFMILRIAVIYFHFEIPFIGFEKDTDLAIQYKLTNVEFTEFYSQSNYYEDDVGRWVTVYLYYWYFIFFPIRMVPFEIMVYIYDFLRIITCIFVILKVYELYQDKLNLKIFLLMYLVGFWYDAFLNNINWMLHFFLLESYLFIEKNKWVSGIFFALGMIKINMMLFFIGLLVIKKLKIKDAWAFLMPLIIICIPYLIFPDYFIQLFNNWLSIEEKIPESSLQNPILVFLHMTWQGFQPAHLLYVSIISFIIFENVNNKNRVRIIVLSLILVYNLLLAIAVLLVII